MSNETISGSWCKASVPDPAPNNHLPAALDYAQADHTLSAEHRRMLLEGSGISPEVAAERGYRTITRRDQLPEFPDWQRRLGLYVPMHSPDGRTSVPQIRPHRPRKKGPKYESPGGSSPIVDVHPRMLEEVQTGDLDLWITEGVKKADALTSCGLPTIGLAGVWMWKVRETWADLLPCFDHVALGGRRVNVAYDSDVMEKEGVQLALERLTEALEARGATVRVVYLPDATDGSKQGVDDYLVAGNEVQELAGLARPFERLDLGQVRLSRDDRLRGLIEGLREDWRDMPAVTDADCVRRSYMKALTDQAEAAGSVHGDWVKVEPNCRSLAERTATSRSVASRTLRQLAKAGRIRRDTSACADGKPQTVWLTPAHNWDSMEGNRRRTERSEPPQGESNTVEGRGSDQPVPAVRAPAPVLPELRCSTLIKSPDYNSFGFAIKDFQQLKRLGKKGGELVRYLLEHDGRATVPDLMNRFAGPATRRRDFVARQLDPMTDPAIIEVRGDLVTLRDDWREALELHRTMGGEQEAARLQAAEHERQRRAYRERRTGGTRSDPSPTPEDMAVAREEREYRLREQRGRPVSYLAAAMRIYLDKNPHDAEQPANWITTTMWAYGWLDRNPTAQESKAAMSELVGGRVPDYERAA